MVSNMFLVTLVYQQWFLGVGPEDNGYTRKEWSADAPLPKQPSHMPPVQKYPSEGYAVEESDELWFLSKIEVLYFSLKFFLNPWQL